MIGKETETLQLWPRDRSRKENYFSFHEVMLNLSSLFFSICLRGCLSYTEENYSNSNLS